jgi:hypothetical protein
MNQRLLIFVLFIVLVFIGFGCFPQNGDYTKDTPAGFFTGIWHGWIAPLSLIVSIFNHSIRIYETNNTGWWYDLGFYMAVISGFGGLALSRKDSKEKH